MSQPFRLLMIGAMYENGGNTAHRFLDGHPDLFVYPFESQLGTRHVADGLASMFPLKYRWPEFLLDATAMQDYRAIIDEETKVRARTPHVSKFRHVPFDFSDDDRARRYVEYVERAGRSRAANVEAFFRATFDAWRDHRSSGRESVYVGYSPAITVDAARILAELPHAHFLHIVRNPWSAYADTMKRPVPMSLPAYMLAWNTNQYHALLTKRMFSDRMHIVRTEDVMANAPAALAPVCEALGITVGESLEVPSWNGEPLAEIYPWGTIRSATVQANLATARELGPVQAEQIRELAWQYLEPMGYAEGW